MRAVASLERRSTESPQLVFPSQGALPVATSNCPFAGSTTAPARPQIAESLVAQLAGSSSPVRLEQSEFHTCRSAPAGLMIATWPWYGGASPIYPPVVAITCPFAKLSAAAIFSREGRFVIDTPHALWPSATASL